MDNLNQPSRPTYIRKHLGILRDSFFTVCGLWGLWLIFVFQLNAKELIAGAGAAVITTAIVQVIQYVWPLSFAPRLKWFLQAWHLPRMILADLMILLKHFFRRIRHQPSHSGCELIRFTTSSDEPRAAAQQAFALIFVSMSPNSVVVHIDQPHARILLHYLTPAPVPGIIGKLQE